MIMFNNIYRGKRVFITGHTGFKGSWLALWLELLGADVTGYALAPPTQPNHFDLLSFSRLKSLEGDIRNRDMLISAITASQPEIVFHLAAQPLVRYAYKYPAETYETNVLGTVNLFEACREISSIKAIINVTSDKCYANQEWNWGYRENDPVGGDDPYSCSKGCAELITDSYRKSFFNHKHSLHKPHLLLASVRAGNVIGGGDWAEDRIIPDIIRAVCAGKSVTIRNPRAVRPWQHVLEPLCGYLRLGQMLLEGRGEFAEAWNFGPKEDHFLSVLDLVNIIKTYWEIVQVDLSGTESEMPETSLLRLDSSKSAFRLHWRPVWDTTTGIRHTITWYRHYLEHQQAISEDQIQLYRKIFNDEIC